ncbi:MAG: LytR/AlgR family response regulator transcription factor [Longimicrobiales bacterium]
MTLRVVVVDDEDLPRQRMRDLVNGHEALTLAGDASDGASALDVILEQRPDLVFLDIQMPELDGFQVIAALDTETTPAIVFVTAYDAHAIRAFEVDAVDYLLKPVTEVRFAAAVSRVLGRLSDRAGAQTLHAMAARINQQRGYATRFVARRSGKHYIVRVADIDWLQAEGNYLRVATGATSHLVRATMKNAEARLDPTRFVRIHRSVLVAIDRIAFIESGPGGEYVVTMPGSVRLTSSRGYSERVRALLR